MPELPEVETIRRDLHGKILNKKIKSLRLLNLGFSKKNTNNLKKLIGLKFLSADRIGKLLIFKTDKKNINLLIHLKMTGQLVYLKNKLIAAGGHSLNEKLLLSGVGGEVPGKHTRLEIVFVDGGKLFFNDMRRFGYVKAVGEEELEEEKKKYGIEPLQKNFTWKNLQNIFKGRKASVKSILLNQKLIAGIGNIYADEILFDAKIMPSRPAGELSSIEIKKIHYSAEKIIKKAIKYRGTTFSNYIDSRGEKGNFSKLLRVYGRKGERCYNCSGLVKKAKIAQRGTHFCLECQK